MSFNLKAKAKVLAVREHTRTISGRRDPVTGAFITENVNLGWFIHLDFGFGVPFAVGVGPEKPDVREDQVLEWSLSA